MRNKLEIHVNSREEYIIPCSTDRLAEIYGLLIISCY